MSQFWIQTKLIQIQTFCNKISKPVNQNISIIGGLLRHDKIQKSDDKKNTIRKFCNWNCFRNVKNYCLDKSYILYCREPTNWLVKRTTLYGNPILGQTLHAINSSQPTTHVGLERIQLCPQQHQQLEINNISYITTSTPLQLHLSNTSASRKQCQARTEPNCPNIICKDTILFIWN